VRVPSRRQKLDVRIQARENAARRPIERGATMTDLYQLSESTDHPKWSEGSNLDATWRDGYDLLRFHRGEKFVFREKPQGKPSAALRLRDVKDPLAKEIDATDLDTAFEVRSELDGYSILVRRHAETVSKGETILAHARGLIGTPYKFGATDCSWLTMHCYGRLGITLQHNAHLQHEDHQVTVIKKDQILPGDLLFHHDDDHVSLYLDARGSGRVIDSEPHDTAAPWGGNLGVGVQVRPMKPNYYCDWENVNGIGRIVAINGKP
jgi:cell wall-associated NlpC family hydrolase